MVLQPLLRGDSWRHAAVLDVMRHRRAAAAEPERELKRIAQDATEAATEGDVDDEVGGRVDDKQQLADDVESHEILREHQTVLKVTLRKCHLSHKT